MRKKIASNSAGIRTRRTRVSASVRREFRAEAEKNWGPVVGPFNGLGPALVEIYEAGAEHPIKTDLLDQVVSIIRRKKRPDERMREIAILMRGWQQVRRG